MSHEVPTMNNNKYFLGLLFLMTLSFSALAQNAFEVTEKTGIEFSDKHVLVLEDKTNQLSAEQALNQLDQFVPSSQVSPFKPSVTYWIYQKLVNRLNSDRVFRIEPTGWKNLTSHIIYADGKIVTLKPVGFVGTHNPYLTRSPQDTSLNQFASQFPVFTVPKDQEVTVLTRVNFQPIFPAKTFSISFTDNQSFAEFRRFSLYMEGLLLGILFALTIFALFNAIQSQDKVAFYYALWISIAFFSVSSLSIIDGHRLFEFFFNIEDIHLDTAENLAYIISIGLAFSQSISYVLFARQYLGIKKFFPKVQAVSNLWIAFALFYGVLTLVGAFYPADTPFSANGFSRTYSVSVGLMLLMLFVCSYLRYKAGFGFAIFFTYAVVPYLIFRVGFLFGIIGLPSPFAYLPDQALGYFLKNPWTNQAFGVCLEALIMALAVISRARWLQSELTATARRQTELIEQQNTLLEAKVHERTQELSAKHELVVSSVNYASRLQRGQLPRAIRTDGRFESFATVWEPRDTIGGDLYWISSSQHDGPFVLSVADCTGHGVPGAMLSLLVSNSLERIYANDTLEDPASALKSLDHFVRTGLNQDRADTESDDGCDAAILKIDRRLQRIEFAGAKIDLFQIDATGQFHRHAAKRISLGYKDTFNPAEGPQTKVIPYQKGDVFALVTDGLTDQIGGKPDGSPTSFGYRRLAQVLTTHRSGSAQKIVNELMNSFTSWQGTYARRDDVTALVFKL